MGSYIAHLSNDLIPVALSSCHSGFVFVQQGAAAEPLCKKTLCKHGEYTNSAVCVRVCSRPYTPVAFESLIV